MAPEYSTMPRAFRGASLMSVITRVQRIGGIDLAEKPADELFVSPCGPERDPIERGGLDSRNLNARDARVGRRGGKSQNRDAHA